jgi:hypothetical protein
MESCREADFEVTARVGRSTAFRGQGRWEGFSNRHNRNLNTADVSFDPNVPMRYPCSNLLRWG